MTEKPDLNMSASAAANFAISQEQPPQMSRSPWLTVEEAAGRARCGVKTIYREVRSGRLQAARIGGRRELRLLAEWVDKWLVQSTISRPA